MSLEGKVCIVTGASVGIGRAYALALAAQGANVVAVARTAGTSSSQGLAEVVAASAALPGRVQAKLCDIEREPDIIRAVDETIADFGRVNVLVNNAGIYTHYDSLSVDSADFDRYLRINLRGPWLTTKYVAPHMVRQRSGSIVNMTSVVAGGSAAGTPGHVDLMHYAVSKAALNRMSTFLAEDLKEHHIAVNALSPGVVLTKTYRGVDPEAAADYGASGVGKPDTPEVMGPPLIRLAEQCDVADGEELVTGQILHHDQFGKSWS